MWYYLLPASHTRAPGLMFYCVSRIHIKESHEGIEPKENFSPELFANADDFVCLICVKKYNGRQNLKNHLVKTHKKSRILTDRENELLEKMFQNLKKFGCAFCKER